MSNILHLYIVEKSLRVAVSFFVSHRIGACCRGGERRCEHTPRVASLLCRLSDEREHERRDGEIGAVGEHLAALAALRHEQEERGDAA